MARVAMIAYTYYRFDPRVRREAEALAARGDDVEMFCLRHPGEAAVEEIGGVRVRHLGMAQYRGASTALYVASYLAFFLRGLFAVGTAHLRRRFDLVHTNNMPDFLAFTALVPRLTGTKLVHDIHDTMPEIYQGKFGVGAGNPMIRLLRLQERLGAGFAHAVLTSEHPKRDALIEHGIPAAKIEVLLNLPDPRIFRRAVEPTEGTPDGFRLVFHGTLAERLGVDVALRAVARLRGEISGLRFDVIGDGDHRPALLALAKKLGIDDIVRFSDGYVPLEQMPDLLRGADLAVIPTREEIGTRYMLPTKLVEYTVLGIPAVVAPTHTIRYYFDEEQVALFEPGDDASLAEVIRELHSDPERRRRLALRCATFLDRYHWDEHKEVYLQLVDRLIGERRG